LMRREPVWNLSLTTPMKCRSNAITHFSRAEMFRVMTRSMDLYRRRHAGRSPRWVMVHKTTEFKSDEIDGCMEALHLCEAVDLVQVVESVSWKGVRVAADRTNGNKGVPAAYPVER